jgi:hypothetical protein
MRFFEVAGGKAAAGVDSGYAHEVDVGLDATDCFDCGSADGNDGMLEETAADKDHFNILMIDEFDGDGGTMRHYGCLEFGWETSRDLYRCCSSVEYDDLGRLNHCGGCVPNHLFLIGGDIETGCEIAHGRGCGKRASVYTLQEAVSRKFSQITANRVF